MIFVNVYFFRISCNVVVRADCSENIYFFNMKIFIFCQTVLGSAIISNYGIGDYYWNHYTNQVHTPTTGNTAIIEMHLGSNRIFQ